MSQKEKSNGIVNFGHATAFNEWIHRWDLMEISDPPRSFTWTNNQENPIMAKLDIILVSVEWENKYPTSQMRKRAGLGGALVREQGRGRLAGGPACGVGCSWRWEGRV
jgi:hypothetical protein